MADIRPDGYANDRQRDQTARLVATGAEITHMPEDHNPHVNLRWPGEVTTAMVWYFGHAVISRPGHTIGEADLIPSEHGRPPLDPGRWVHADRIEDDEVIGKQWVIEGLAAAWPSSAYGGWNVTDGSHGGGTRLIPEDVSALARIIEWTEAEAERAQEGGA